MHYNVWNIFFFFPFFFNLSIFTFEIIATMYQIYHSPLKPIHSMSIFLKIENCLWWVGCICSWMNVRDNWRGNELRINNPEILATLCAIDTGQRQTTPKQHNWMYCYSSLNTKIHSFTLENIFRLYTFWRIKSLNFLIKIYLRLQFTVPK